MPPLPSVHGQTQALWETESDRSTLPISQKVTRFSGPEAARNEPVTGLVSKIFNESFGHRPDGKPYRLGPKSMAERLASTDFLFIAGDEQSGIGYFFGKEIPCHGRKNRLDRVNGGLTTLPETGYCHCLATQVLPDNQRIIQSRMRDPESYCGFGGDQRPYPEPCISETANPPAAMLHMLREIRQHCFDLRGCAIQKKPLRIKTGFSPLSRSDEREWNPRTPSSPPYWWSELEHLPNAYEALLVIERTDNGVGWISVA